MKIVYTEEALRNLDEIHGYIHDPTISEAFQLRLRFVVARIAKWPESAQEVADQSGVRASGSLPLQGILSCNQPDDRNTVHSSFGAKHFERALAADSLGAELRGINAGPAPAA